MPADHLACRKDFWGKGVLRPHQRIDDRIDREWKLDAPYTRILWCVALFQIEAIVGAGLAPGFLLQTRDLRSQRFDDTFIGTRLSSTASTLSPQNKTGCSGSAFSARTTGLH